MKVNKRGIGCERKTNIKNKDIYVYLLKNMCGRDEKAVGIGIKQC